MIYGERVGLLEVCLFSLPRGVCYGKAMAAERVKADRGVLK